MRRGHLRAASILFAEAFWSAFGHNADAVKLFMSRLKAWTADAAKRAARKVRA